VRLDGSAVVGTRHPTVAEGENLRNPALLASRLPSL